MSSTSNRYIKGPMVNPQAKKDSLEAKQPYIDNGISRVSPERYYTKDPQGTFPQQDIHRQRI